MPIEIKFYLKMITLCTFDIETDYYLSLLPTATAYSRNAIFSGYFPKQIQAEYPEIWSKMWSDESYAQELGMTGADWSGEDNSSGSIFWTANDTHYHDAFEDKSHDQFQRLKPEYKEQYNTFYKHKHLADTYVIKLMGGRPVMREPVGEVTPETFEHQKHWRISLSPRSKSISDRGDATYDSVGYGKGRYMGD